MNNDDRIREEVEKTLRLFEDDAIPGGNPYLYTRIKARLERQHAGQSRPFFALSNLKYAGIAALFLINILTAILSERRSTPDLHAQVVSQLKADLQIDQDSSNF
jgi:hypothetical protein